MVAVKCGCSGRLLWTSGGRGGGRGGDGAGSAAVHSRRPLRFPQPCCDTRTRQPCARLQHEAGWRHAEGQQSRPVTQCDRCCCCSARFPLHPPTAPPPPMLPPPSLPMPQRHLPQTSRRSRSANTRASRKSKSRSRPLSPLRRPLQRRRPRTMRGASRTRSCASASCVRRVCAIRARANSPTRTRSSRP